MLFYLGRSGLCAFYMKYRRNIYILLLYVTYLDLIMALRDVEQWNTFFKNEEAVKYASTFIANRITEEFLSDLSKENLTDLGITIVGDILGTIRHSKYLTSSPTVPPSSDIPRSNSTSIIRYT